MRSLLSDVHCSIQDLTPELLRVQKDLGDDSFKNLMAKLIEHLPELVQNLSDLLDQKKWDTAYIVAHSLKSNFELLGWQDLKALSRDLEKETRALKLGLNSAEPLIDMTKAGSDEDKACKATKIQKVLQCGFLPRFEILKAQLANL